MKEYLPLLQEREKWNKVKNSLKRGDIVAIMDSTAPRGSWPLGRVLETFPDKKGLVRSVRLQTKTSVIDRPVAKLCFLHESELRGFVTSIMCVLYSLFVFVYGSWLCVDNWHVKSSQLGAGM